MPGRGNGGPDLRHSAIASNQEGDAFGEAALESAPRSWTTVVPRRRAPGETAIGACRQIACGSRCPASRRRERRLRSSRFRCRYPEVHTLRGCSPACRLWDKNTARPGVLEVRPGSRASRCAPRHRSAVPSHPPRAGRPAPWPRTPWKAAARRDSRFGCRLTRRPPTGAERPERQGGEMLCVGALPSSFSLGRRLYLREGGRRQRIREGQGAKVRRCRL